MSDKELFERYEEVRVSGKYNMITDSKPAMKEAGLKYKDYFYVMFNYSLLRERYGDSNAKTKND